MMLRPLLDALWNENVWLPPNTTWADVAPAPDKKVVYTDHRHLLLTIPMGLAFIIVRYVLEKYVFTPLGKSLGINNGNNKKPSPSPKMEAAYGKNFTPKQICALAKQLDMSERQVERWIRLRRSQDKPSTLVKFCENAWRCTFYVYNFSFGVTILWNKVWLWDIDHVFIGHPHHGVTNDMWWYYMISSAFYWSLTISQFWDVRRKDYRQAFVHHFATIALLFLSWVCNFHRIGALVLMSHDCADIFLELAKTLKYAGYQRLCDTVFVLFILVWFVTRLWYFPFYIVWRTAEQTLLPEYFPALYIFLALFCVLFMLHLVWTWLILQLAYNTIKAGHAEGDIRSSSSDISDSDYSNHSTSNLISDKNLTMASDDDDQCVVLKRRRRERLSYSSTSSREGSPHR